MRLTILLLATALLANACGTRIPDCGDDGLVYDSERGCVCPTGTRFVCNEDTTMCACEPLDAGTPSDAGVPSDAPPPTDGGCTASAEMLCGTTCVDTNTSADHCGACDTPCAAPNACVEGACVDPVIDIEVGGTHACALRGSGQVWCWGSNLSGQLGDGTTVERHTPVRAGTIDDAVQISLGGIDLLGRGRGMSTCARHASGAVSCWGFVSGTTDAAGTERNVPTPVASVSDVIDISVGNAHACAVTGDGRVRCWGGNSFGQLGDGLTASWRTSATEVTGITTARHVSAGVEHTCAVLTDSTVVCWGEGSAGQLGQRRLEDSFSPVAAQGVTNVGRVRAGVGCTCAHLEGGAISCWGDNQWHCLGYDMSRTVMPYEVPGGRDFEWFTENDTVHACGRRATGAVVCWGVSWDGIRSDGGIPGFRTPVERPYWEGAVDVAGSQLFECALLPTGRVACVGGNYYGQLGDGTTETRDAPVEVVGLP